MSLPLLALALGACGPAAAPAPEAGDSGAADTGGGEGDGPAVLLAATPAEGTAFGAPLTAAAVAFRFGEGPATGATLASARLGAPSLRDTARARLALPETAPARDLADLGADATGAVYALLVFEDADGDGAWTEGETLAGLATDRWLLWIAVPPDAGAGAGLLERGWNLVDLGLQGTYEDDRCLLDTDVVLDWREGWPRAADPADAVAVALHGLPASLSLAGEVALEAFEDDALAAIPYQRLAGTDDALDPFFDVPLRDGAFAATLDAAPPDAADVGADPDWRYALGYPLAYRDAAGDGWSPDDPLSGATPCHEGRPVAVRYTRPVRSWKGWRLLDCYGATVGWRAVVQDPDTGQPRFLDAEAAATLRLDGTCSLGG